MDMSAIAARLGLSGSRPVVRKPAELRRLCDINFDSSVLGIGEVCKAIICLKIAASKFQVIFDRAEAVHMSGMSEKAYIRSFNALQNGLGVKTTLDVRELGIQFDCVRLIPFVQKGLSLYKERFLAALPPSRRQSTDFGPVFTAAAFYLCAKRHKLKVDKLKLIDLCGTSSAEFTTEIDELCDEWEPKDELCDELEPEPLCPSIKEGARVDSPVSNDVVTSDFYNLNFE